MNKIIKINWNLNKEISYADESVVKGFVSKNETTVEDVVKIKLSKVLKTDNNGLMFKSTQDKLIFLVNEIVNKSSKKELLFLDSWPRDEVYKNVAIIVKIDDSNLKSKLNNKNGVVIFCGCESSGLKMQLDMTRIELLDFATTELNPKSFDISEFDLSFESKSGLNMELVNVINSQISNEFSVDPLTSKSKPAFDFRRRGERLQLNEFSEFVMHFNKFLKEKSRARENVFVLGQNVIEKQSGDIFGSDFKLMVSIKDRTNIKFIEKGEKVTISSLDDNDITFPGIIESSHKVDFNEQVSIIVDEMKERLQQLQVSATEKSKEIDEVWKQNDNLSKVEQGLSNEKNKILVSLEEVEEELKELNSSTKNLDQKIKNTKPKKSKKKKLTVKTDDESIEITIAKYNAEKKDILKKIKTLEAKRDTINAEYKEIGIKYNETSDKINRNKIFIEREKISKKELDDECDFISKNIKKIESEWKRIYEKDYLFYQIVFKSFHKEGKPKNEFTLSPLNIRKGEFHAIFSPKYVISSFDYGTFVKFKRYDNALTNIRGGYYKNPYLALSLLRPSLISQEKFDKTMSEVDIILKKDKHSLNENQRKAVAKALASNDISYIQGPPGTGKTETISAIAQLSVSKGETLLISSSTHAAIDNFFERLDKTYSMNPNLFMLRYVHKKKEDRTYYYEEREIYPRFLNTIDKNAITHLGKQKESNLSKEEVKQRLSEFDKVKNSPFAISHNFLEGIVAADDKSFNIFCQLIEKIVWSNLFEAAKNEAGIDSMPFIEDMEDLIHNHETKSKIDQRKFAKNFDDTILPFIKLIKENRGFINFNEQLDFLMNAFGDDHEKEVSVIINKAEKFINDDAAKIPAGLEVFNKFINVNATWRKNINSPRTSSNYAKNNLELVGEKTLIDMEEMAFLKSLAKNQLLNVIGITTTSIKKIRFANELIDLFSEYSIDRVIIDEISKSNTPEIISNILMASKVTFAGDYRQLSPIFDVTDDLLKDFVETIHFADWFRKNRYVFNSTTLGENAEDESSEENTLSNEEDKVSEMVKITRQVLEKLYENSLFKNQIKEITLNQKGQLNSYQYLTEQYRFTSEINELVNRISYRGQEALVAMGKFETIDLVVGRKRLSRSMNVIDTSALTEDYISFLKEITKNTKGDQMTIESLKVGDEAFDQWTSLIRYRNKKENSLVNEFNAYVVSETISSILQNNNDVKTEEIGVITMTASQVKIVEFILKEKGINGVKVDTVDNFQGREKNIVIVDLVRAKNNYAPNSEISGKIINIDQKKRNLEFYRKPERFNVAISRAKSKLILIGDFLNNLQPIVSQISNDGRDESIQMFKTALEIALKENENGEKGAVRWTK